MWTSGKELPPAELGHEPSHGGRVIAIAASREMSDIPAITAADAARELGVSMHPSDAQARGLKTGDDVLVFRMSPRNRASSSPTASGMGVHVFCPVLLSCRFVFDFLSKRWVTFPRVALC